MKILISAGISVLITFAAILGFYYFVPIGFMEGSPSIGTTITTINGSDTLSASRTTINNNFTALNNGKIENSTSSVAAITTLSNLVTVGALTSGSLGSGFTIIGVAQGGTGSSTLSVNQILLGNSASGVKVVAGYGTAGQLLTSNGAGNAPYWSSPSVDTTIAYLWTGNHIFTASSTFYEISITNSGLATTTITKTEIDKLVGGATTNAATLHYHAANCANGWLTKNRNDTAASVISHGLGVAPTSITVNTVSNNGGTIMTSNGYATSTSAQNSIYSTGATANIFNGIGTSTIAFLSDNGGTAYVSATISAISATTFTITWGTNIDAGGQRNLIWSACK